MAAIEPGPLFDPDLQPIGHALAAELSSGQLAFELPRQQDDVQQAARHPRYIKHHMKPGRHSIPEAAPAIVPSTSADPPGWRIGAGLRRKTRSARSVRLPRSLALGRDGARSVISDWGAEGRSN